MRLFEHPDFEQALVRAAERYHFSEQFIEKDYWITQILSIVAQELGDHVIFKGGTSLSKGWGLITRFSEDIDLLLNTESYTACPGRNRINRLLRDLATKVAAHPGLTPLPDEGTVIGGLGREDYFAYPSHFAALPELRPVVRLEPGIQSGNFPTEKATIGCLVGDYLREQSLGDLADDLQPFPMTLLHFRRTFVEKLFTIHGKVVRLLTEDVPLGRDVRHYPDLFALLGEGAVRRMLASPEYREIREDYDEKSWQFYARSYRPPPELSFAESPALFPDPELRDTLARAYHISCRPLFASRDAPHFEEILARFAEVRALL